MPKVNPLDCMKIGSQERECLQRQQSQYSEYDQTQTIDQHQLHVLAMDLR